MDSHHELTTNALNAYHPSIVLLSVIILSVILRRLLRGSRSSRVCYQVSGMTPRAPSRHLHARVCNFGRYGGCVLLKVLYPLLPAFPVDTVQVFTRLANRFSRSTGVRRNNGVESSDGNVVRYSTCVLLIVFLSSYRCPRAYTTFRYSRYGPKTATISMYPMTAYSLFGCANSLRELRGDN